MSQSRSNELVRRTRFIVLAITRLVAATMIVTGAYALINAVIVGQVWSGGLGGLLVYYDAGKSWIGVALGLLIVGGLLALMSQRLAAWIAPVITNDCLKCGYPLQNLHHDHCPECGIVIDAAQTPSKDHNPPSAAAPSAARSSA